MKKKSKFSLDNLVLNKETVFNLSDDQMKNLVGGVTNTGGCHSIDTQCLSMDTNCFSKCQPGCVPEPSEQCTLAECPPSWFCTIPTYGTCQYD